MRYRLTPGTGCPSDLCDQLNAALSTSALRRLFHSARTAVRSYRAAESVTVHDDLAEVLRHCGMGFPEAMLLPVRFDMTARPISRHPQLPA